MPLHRPSGRKVFCSEEKDQTDFYVLAFPAKKGGAIHAQARKLLLAVADSPSARVLKKQKFFGSFFQKRTFLSFVFCWVLAPG